MDGCFCRHRVAMLCVLNSIQDFVSKIRQSDEKSEEIVTKILILDCVYAKWLK